MHMGLSHHVSNDTSPRQDMELSQQVTLLSL